MEALFKKAKEAYQEGRGGTLSRILAKLEGNGETIESLELQFQELFTRVIVERNFL